MSVFFLCYLTSSFYVFLLVFFLPFFFSSYPLLYQTLITVVDLQQKKILFHESFKTYICDKWICSTENSRSTPITDSILLHYYSAECGLSGSNVETHNLKVWTVTSDLPWTLSRVCLPIEPLYSHSAKRRMERNWGDQHWNASLLAADLVMTSESL